LRAIEDAYEREMDADLPGGCGGSETFDFGISGKSSRRDKRESQRN